jgi:iron-sulfur cluster assembly accessory protein
VDQARQTDDVVVERNGATVLIDETSMGFLKGSIVDFVDDLMGQSFRIENPQATSSCGCGTSFSL